MIQEAWMQFWGPYFGIASGVVCFAIFGSLAVLLTLHFATWMTSVFDRWRGE